MLDTCTRTTVRPLLPVVVDAIGKGELDAVAGWTFTYSRHAPSIRFADGFKITGHHIETGLYVTGVPYQLRSWNVSLPRVLHGFNGTQLKSQSEIDAAFLKVHNILNEISTGPGLAETYRRLDVAINLSHPEPQRLVLALRNARHRSIRKETEKYAVGSIRYAGTEVTFTAYWKHPAIRTTPKRKAWKTAGALRLELQLKSGNKIAEFLGGAEAPIYQLPPIGELYDRFRDFMLGFPACRQGDTKCSMAALMALCESQGIRHEGESVMDWHARSVSASGHSKMRTKVAEISSRFLEIDWAELLPVDAIPETVDVSLDGTTSTVPAVPIVRSRPCPVRFGFPPPAYATT